MEATTRPVSGTFVQFTPGPGRTWHIAIVPFSGPTEWTLCGRKISNAEWNTTGIMPEFKVCAACKEEAAR